LVTKISMMSVGSCGRVAWEVGASLHNVPCRQLLTVIRKGQQRLRMKRYWHIDAFVVVVSAFEADVFRRYVLAGTPQKFRERRVAPSADRTPSFDADVPRDSFRPSATRRLCVRRRPVSMAFEASCQNDSPTISSLLRQSASAPAPSSA
jgi:hypothetical protein